MLATHRHRIAPRYRSSSDTRKCRLDAFFDQPGQASLIYNPSSPIINEKRCIECRFRKPNVHIEWGREISHRQIHSLLRWPPFTGACWSAGMRRRQSALRIEKRSLYPVTRCAPLALRPEGGSQVDIRVRLAAVSCIDWIALRIGRLYAELTSPISVCEVLVNQYQTMHFMSENIEDLAHLSHAC